MGAQRKAIPELSRFAVSASADTGIHRECAPVGHSHIIVHGILIFASILDDLGQEFFLPLNHLVDSLDVLIHIFYIFCPLSPVLLREHHLRGGSRSAGGDGLHFLHNENVVDAGLSRQGITHILKISRHIFWRYR